jgi:hypothetical protein
MLVINVATLTAYTFLRDYEQSSWFVQYENIARNIDDP